MQDFTDNLMSRRKERGKGAPKKGEFPSSCISDGNISCLILIQLVSS